MIDEAESALRKASQRNRIGRFQLEAAIQSAHIAGGRSCSPRWKEILTLYDALVDLTASPVASINRALVLAEVDGPEAGLDVLEALAADTRLESYQPLLGSACEPMLACWRTRCGASCIPPGDRP